MQRIMLTAIAALLTTTAAHADSQSSNSSSNSSSNNGVTRETRDESYCDDYGCDRIVERRVYRDAPRRSYCGEARRYWREARREREERRKRYRDYRDDDD